MTPARIFAAFAVLVSIALISIEVSSVRLETQTYDEAVYIAAGYSYWKTWDYRINPEHPPIAKLLVSAPLLFINLNLPTDDPSWRTADEYGFGSAFLYGNTAPAGKILLTARCVTIALSVLFALSVAAWARRRAGPWCAAIALLLFAFDPNLIAHGRYATNDVALAFFLFLAIVAWSRALRTLSLLDFALAGIALGLTVFTKASGVVIFPMFLLLALLRARDIRRLLIGSAIAAAAATFVGLLAYHGALVDYANVLNISSTHVLNGQPSDLLEQASQRGWWYFYPFVFAVKTPIAVLALFVLAIVVYFRKRMPVGEWSTLLVPIVVYSIICIASPVDIGIRILLPILPFAYLLTAMILQQRQQVAIVATLLLALIIESTVVYPNYLAFFNAFAGGPSQGPRYLVDSNIDWGQDLLELKRWLDARHIDRVCLNYFGMANSTYYGYSLMQWNGKKSTRADCVAAVSATWIYSGAAISGTTFAWLRSETPIARVGYSIYVYDFRKKPLVRIDDHSR